MTSKLTVEQVENAFLPAREILEPERFAGRADLIKQAYLGLVSQGTNLAILGNRGVGKSSLARQLVKLAGGSTTLLERYAIKHDRALDFLAFYYTCGNSIQGTNQLLDRLLTSDDCLSPWVYDIPTAKKLLTAYSPKFEAKLLGVGVELGGSKTTETTMGRAAPGPDTVSVFTNVLGILAKEKPAKDGILIVVDEFDQIQDKSGFASLLKSLATNVPTLRFAIVGVAHDLYALMAEHGSSDRLFAGGVLNTPPMSEGELRIIVDMAEACVDNQIAFSEDARMRLVRLSQGHPYMLHLLGKHSLREAWDQGRTVIDATQIDTTLQNIASSGADPVLENRYKRAIQSSPQREAVLRALAQVERNGEAWTTEAYPIATAAGVENPSQYVAHLGATEYGAEIAKVRERYYRFKDSLFRVYVRARPPQYAPSEVSNSQS